MERNGGISVGNRYLLSGMGEIAGAVERKKERKKKMGDRAWHVSTRKLGSTARPEKREYIYIYIYIFDSQEGRLGARGSLRAAKEEEREREKG